MSASKTGDLAFTVLHLVRFQMTTEVRDLEWSDYLLTGITFFGSVWSDLMFCQSQDLCPLPDTGCDLLSSIELIR